MAESTPRFSIAYPTEHEQPFYSSFEQGILAIDSLLFAGFEGRNAIGFGGGTIVWDGGVSNGLSFTEDLKFASPTFGQLLTWSAGESPIVIDPGHFLVFALTRGSTVGVALTSGGGTPSVITTSSVPISGQSQVIAYHDPVTSELVFFNGLLLAGAGGTSLTGLGQAPTTGSAAPPGAQYLTFALSAGLTAERQLSAVRPLDFVDGGVNAVLEVALGERATVSTVDATPVIAQSIAVASNTIVRVKSTVWGRVSGSNDDAVYGLHIARYINIGGVTSLWDLETSLPADYSPAATLTTAKSLISLVGSNIRINVTGEVATNIDWRVRTEVEEEYA